MKKTSFKGPILQQCQCWWSSEKPPLESCFSIYKVTKKRGRSQPNTGRPKPNTAGYMQSSLSLLKMTFFVCKAVSGFCSHLLYIPSHPLFYPPSLLYIVKNKQICFTDCHGVDYRAVLGQTGLRPGLLERTGCNAFLWIQSAASEGDTTRINPCKRPEQFAFLGFRKVLHASEESSRGVRNQCKDLCCFYTQKVTQVSSQSTVGIQSTALKDCTQASHEAGSRSQDLLQVPCCSSIIYP